MLVGVNSVDLCILVIVVLVSMLCAYLLDFVAVFLDLVVFVGIVRLRCGCVL